VPSFRAMGWPDATAASHLLAAMTAEIAIRELEAGRRLPASRRSLRRFLGL
jgi:TetR/AcrR family transcriptional repressor of nem operon